MNFCNIDTIPEFICEYFEKFILPYKDKITNYSLVITGPIGVGKSTLCQIIKMLFEKYEFSVNPICEYIDYDKNGTLMLEKYLSGEISNPTFQNFIIDVYKLQCINGKKSQITISERPVEDSIACFANISSKIQDDFTDLQLLALNDRCNKIINKYQIPSYSDPDTKFTTFMSNDLEISLLTILNNICKDFQLGITKRIIGLDINLEKCKERIYKRGRECEKVYSDEYLQQIIVFYRNIYNLKLSDKKLNITLFDSLLKDNMN